MDPAGATNFEFSETVTVPSAGGEHHFEMKAVDANGVEMETGFPWRWNIVVQTQNRKGGQMASLFMGGRCS